MIPFEPERHYSASIRAQGDEHVVFVKGAPERVLAMCTQVLMPGGAGPLEQALVLEAGRELASEGLRVLGMAYGRIPRPPRPDRIEEPVPGIPRRQLPIGAPLGVRAESVVQPRSLRGHCCRAGGARDSAVPSRRPSSSSVSSRSSSTRGCGWRSLVEKLQALIPDGAEARGIETHVEILENKDVGAAICSTAERLGIDLICLGSPGRSGLVSTLAGSVARRTMRRTTRPLLIVRVPEMTEPVSWHR